MFHLLRCFNVLAFLSIPSLAQTVEGLTGGNSESRLNQQFLEQRNLSTPKTKERDVVVFIGDRVIPQFVDGASWKTSITVVNLENRAVNFQVLFFRDNGTDLIVPVVGQGLVRGMNIALGTLASLTFETSGTADTLSQGWALLSQSTNDSVGGLAIFRQRVAGRPDFEAVVPIVNQFDNHFVLLFDNTAFTTATAIANPTPLLVVIPVNIRNEAGQIIDTRTISLGGYGHTAFTLPDAWPSTAGRRGAVEFLTSGFGVGALGLRFSAAAFTSFHVLSNFAWRN
ncbi:MAG: hypothetical protein HY235_15500 [Acidobacteria bacterium]|nr:hypothetical protein [Acidobacteriota bacterium]